MHAEAKTFKERLRAILRGLFARPVVSQPTAETGAQTDEGTKGIGELTKPRPRRKCIPGAFAKHKKHRVNRFVGRNGRALGELVAIRTAQGLRFASRREYRRLLAVARAHSAALSRRISDSRLEISKEAN